MESVNAAKISANVAKMMNASPSGDFDGCKIVSRDYEVALSDVELVVILEESAALSAEIDADKNELESLKTRATTLRKGIEENLEVLSYKLSMSRSKRTRREIACYEVFDWDTDTVQYINVDTGEEMERLPIPEDRKQGALRFAEVPDFEEEK